MSNPVFSIVVPFFNPGALIKHSVDSINNLMFKDFEVIFVDDGTTEHLSDIYEYIQKRSSFNYRILKQDNLGIGVARNTGMNVAKGKWILFLDCDDAISPDSLTKYFNIISSCETNVSMIFTMYKIVEKKQIQEFEQNDNNSINYLILNAGDAARKFLKRLLVILAPGTIYRLDFLRDNDLQFDSIRWSEDQLFVWNVLFKSKKIIFLKAALYNYLTSVSTSIMASTKIDQMIAAFPLFENLKDACPYKKVSKFIASRWLLGTLHTIAARNDFNGFKKIYIKCSARKYINKLLLFGKCKEFFLALSNLIFGKKILYYLLRRF